MGVLAPPKALVLEGSEHDGRFAVVGMTTSEGSPRVVHEHSCHILVFGGYRDPDHDAVMRIAAKLRGGGPILVTASKPMGQCGIPPPRTVIGTCRGVCGQGQSVKSC